jgi:DNA-binding GntR family transcriptional regulator
MTTTTMTRVDPANYRVPLYEQLAAIIRDMITSGELQPNDRLPGEPALAQHHGIAKETVRRALYDLRHEGWIVTHRRKGQLRQRPAGPRASRVGRYASPR